MDGLWKGVSAVSRRSLFEKADRLEVAVTAGGSASLLLGHGVAFACIGGDCSSGCACDGVQTCCTGYNCDGTLANPCCCTFSPLSNCYHAYWSQQDGVCYCFGC